MKKLTLSLVAAGFAASSLGAYAAVPTGAAPFQVVVPNLKSGIELTLEGLYVQPTNSDLVYSYFSNTSGNTATTNTSSVKPDYAFGFRTGFGYIFPNSGNDVQVNWTHFDHSTNASTSIANPAFSIIPASTSTNSADASFKYDAVDLDVGQYLSIGTRLQTRLFVGVRGAQLKNDVTYTQSNSLAPAYPNVQTTTSKFTGIGPRMGVDTSYHVGNCFGIVAHFATALLVGNVDSNTTVSESGNSRISNFTTDTQTRVVPAFDAKLGVDYSIPFKNNASSLSIEAGYQVTQYVDAIDRIHALEQSTSTTTTSSVGFNGPYLSLNFKV